MELALVIGECQQVLFLCNFSGSFLPILFEQLTQSSEYESHTPNVWNSFKHFQICVHFCTDYNVDY